jgi:hypothetical protein
MVALRSITQSRPRAALIPPGCVGAGCFGLVGLTAREAGFSSTGLAGVVVSSSRQLTAARV